MIHIRLAILCCLLGIEGVYAQAPVPDFSASSVAGCGPLYVSFRDLSTGKPFSWTWDFGNGVISSQQNPSVTYYAPGTYTVTLIVKNSSGVNSIQKVDYITVYAFPTAGFSGDRQIGCAPVNVHYTDLSTPGQGSITSWTWDFGDGGTSASPNPSHTFTGTGYYNIALTVVNSGGCSNKSILSRYLRVVPGVQPDFSWSQASASCSAPYDINFTNQTAGPGNLTYAWDLGNNSNSIQKNPSATYPSNTNYTVRLSATSDFGCSATTSKVINFQATTPVISAPDSVCINSTVNFVNSSSPPPLSSSWDFGDGSNAAVTNPDKSYLSPGTYTVTLTNTYNSCSASSTKSIVILNNPTVSFSADKSISCSAPLTVNFSSLLAGATSWQWSFGDGGTATSEKPQHTYSSTGNFNVTLTAATAKGCSATSTLTNYIRITPPSATLNSASTQGCTGGTIQPIANINALDGVQSYQWAAPGATPSSSTAASPAFTYSAQGTYDLTLTFTTNGGCIFTKTFSNAVVIGDPVAPVFTASTQVSCAHQPVTFSSASTPVDSWHWNFGDKSTSGTGPTVTHAYSDTGFFNVSLTVLHHGCAQTHAEPQYIYINPPIAGFRYRTDCSNRHHVAFIDTSKIDPAKGPITYAWDFGDPAHTTSPLQNPSFDFLTLTTYTIREIVTNGSCSDTVRTSINLTPIQVSFSYPDTVCREAPFILSSTSTPASNIDSFAWRILIAAYSTPSTLSSYTGSFPDTGAYSVSLKVIDHNGCPYISAPATIHVTGPYAKFGPYGTAGCRNSPITFTDQSTPYPGYTLSSWTLDFGDGNTQAYPSATPPFTHNYTDTGSYRVHLTVKDNRGCTDTTSILTPVHISSPRPGFYARDTLYCPNAPLPFTDSSRGYGLTYSWDFGDGSTTSTGRNPSHPYSGNAQYYSVKLVVADGAGCSDSVTRKNYIHIQKPIAAFTLLDSTGICVPLQTSFLPAGQYYDSLYWNFGDGNTSNLDTTTHFYNNYNTYTATLVLQGAGGCRDSAKRNIYIYQPYNITSFTFSPVSGCDSVTAGFAITPPPYTRFSLLFGDGAVDSSGNSTPSHTYRLLAAFTPQLILQDSTGCIVTINNSSITVLGAVTFFGLNEKKFCDSGTVFLSGAVISNDLPFNVLWDFGDGTSGQGKMNKLQQDTSHYYSTPGIMPVTLSVNTNTGCREKYTDTLHIYQTPHPVITAPSLLCINLPLPFQGSLAIPDPVDTVNWAWSFGDGQTSKDPSPLVSYPHAGIYTVSLRTFVSYGCSDTTSQLITINGRPTVTGPPVITTPVGFPVTIPFTYSTGITTWTWTPPANLSCSDCPNPVASPTFSTLYTVLVTDSNNCTTRDSIRVTTICNTDNYFIPNTFSPNNDGVNDAFYPRGKSLYNVQSMRVFNRWGQMVFERKNFPANAAASGWDGNFNGHPAPPDVYVYIVEVICDNAQIVALKGDITLIR